LLLQVKRNIMAIAVIMPRQGQSVETCILGQWYKEVGDEIKTGDILFSYETDKASFEEEAKISGFLLARYFEPGDEVPVLAEVAIIGEQGEKADAKKQTKAQAKEGSGISDEESPIVIEFAVEPGTPEAERIAISPLARNMAHKLEIDFSTLSGTGPQGRIIARDIEAAARLSASAIRPATQPDKPATPVEKVQPVQHVQSFAGVPGDFEIKPLSNMRKLIARAMYASLQNSAQLTHHLSADARNLLAARKKFKSEYESGKSKENITINDLVCQAVIRALKQFPQVNSHFLGEQIKYFSKVHLGLAIDTDRGLMVPALQNADDYSLTGLSGQLKQLAADCRKGSVNPDLLNPEAATFTISNLGNYGVEMFTPVINLPQTAILGVCAIVPRPKDIGDGIYAIVPMIGLSLTYDHRALDGGEATRFLAEIRRQIEGLEL
jgi:pyruvate dehydrogenase E2 component (dihydrolipoamide acetyltransferase)